MLRRLVCAAFVATAAPVFSANLAPELTSPVANRTFTMGDPAQDVNLQTHFRDPDVTGSVVRVNVRIGSTVKAVDLALFNQETPITVANFLAYVNSGRFDANFFHRSVPGFVVQGGGFYWTDAGSVQPVPTDAAIQNEPGISNLRGTIAMAKLGGDANSATSGWFVNLADNSANLDSQNGGFTVFGRVLGDGMTVIDEIAALPRWNAGSPFDTLPLKNYSGEGDILRVHTVETNSRIVPALSFSATSSNPQLVGVTVTGSTVQIVPAANRFGTATITLSATDLDGATTETTFTVEVLSTLAPLPAPVVSKAFSGAPVPEAGSAGLPPGTLLTAFGTPAISDAQALATRVTMTAGTAKRGGIYYESVSGENRLVAWQGQESGIQNGLFKTFRDPVISSGGKIAFAATLAGVPATQNEGVWSDVFGELQPVLQKGADLPGQPGLKLKSVTSVSLEDAALLAFVKLARSPGSVTATNDAALVRITSLTSSVLLARTGAALDGSTIKQISVLQPAARSAGQGRWTGASGTLAKITLFNGRSVIARLLSDGTQTVLLRAGVADANLGATLAALGLPALGGSAVAVLASYAKLPGSVTAANDATLLYAADGSTFSQVIREQAGPAKFSTFSDPVANDQGGLLFFGTQRASAAGLPNVTGLWLSAAGSAPTMLARVGTPALDGDGQPLANANWQAITNFALPDGPGAGPIFVAQLAGRAVNAQSKLGLWARDSDGIARMLLRTGQDLVLPTGTKRVVNFNLLNALAGSFGARRSYNATRSVAVHVTFTDRSQAVIRLDVP
jgi:cyclophilin family peptidyl-prolyl cis-trans isomerase